MGQCFTLTPWLTQNSRSAACLVALASTHIVAFIALYYAITIKFYHKVKM